jgi:metallophosphoesterase (TIGR00282 family)
VIANAENSAGGFGITEKIAASLLEFPIDVLTGGNHSFDKREALPYINEEPRVLRPANYPPDVPGRGVWLGEARNGARVAVVNLQGRVFMHGVDDPFREANRLLDEYASQTDIIFIDFHAEATSEKVAFGWHLDGRVAAVAGTHTHVQTADARVLPGGTAYITDVGMTGPQDSVIGIRKEDALSRFRLGIPSRFQVAKGDPVFCAVSLQVDEKRGLAEEIVTHWEMVTVDANDTTEAEE